MNRKWITGTTVAAASLALLALSTGVAQAAPGQGGCLRPLVEAGTITQAQADEVHAAKQAMKESGLTGREAHDEALAALVANGTLTQAQADAVASSRRQTGQGREARGQRGVAGNEAAASAPARSNTTTNDSSAPTGATDLPRGYAR